MAEVMITTAEDGSRWVPCEQTDPNAGCEPGYSRVGKFTVESELVRRGEPLLFALLSQVIVLRCEHLYYKNQFEYVAYSSHFRPCHSAEVPPSYFIVAHQTDGEVTGFEFKEATQLAKE